jgi:hypothetical protein
MKYMAPGNLQDLLTELAIVFSLMIIFVDGKYIEKR